MHKDYGLCYNGKYGKRIYQSNVFAETSATERFLEFDTVRGGGGAGDVPT